VPVRLKPDASLRDVRKTDLIVVPASEFDLTAARKANAPLVPWLRRWHERGTAIAGICTGVSLLAEAGLLDGRPATTHWSVVEQCRQRYPRVEWHPERFVTESRNVFCGGGVYASIDLSLYLVEKYCGHEVAVQTAKALLLQTPRTWQSSYAMSPPGTALDDEAIHKTQD
jgi:transcriptional regulator GlxA family with amidase domain